MPSVKDASSLLGYLGQVSLGQGNVALPGHGDKESMDDIQDRVPRANRGMVGKRALVWDGSNGINTRLPQEKGFMPEALSCCCRAAHAGGGSWGTFLPPFLSSAVWMTPNSTGGSPPMLRGARAPSPCWEAGQGPTGSRTLSCLPCLWYHKLPSLWALPVGGSDGTFCAASSSHQFGCCEPSSQRLPGWSNTGSKIVKLSLLTTEIGLVHRHSFCGNVWGKSVKRKGKEIIKLKFL
jgi:hypothetical protein